MFKTHPWAQPASRSCGARGRGPVWLCHPEPRAPVPLPFLPLILMRRRRVSDDVGWCKHRVRWSNFTPLFSKREQTPRRSVPCPAAPSSSLSPAPVMRVPSTHDQSNHHKFWGPRARHRCRHWEHRAHELAQLHIARRSRLSRPGAPWWWRAGGGDNEQDGGCRVWRSRAAERNEKAKIKSISSQGPKSEEHPGTRPERGGSAPGGRGEGMQAEPGKRKGSGAAACPRPREQQGGQGALGRATGRRH